MTDDIGDIGPPQFFTTGKFLIARAGGRYDGHEPDIYVVRGGAHPYTYKTFRGAAREIRKHDRDEVVLGRGARAPVRSLILQWEPGLLPLVAPDEPLLGDPLFASRMTDLEFCDRQVQLWAQLAERARRSESVTYDHTFSPLPEKNAKP